MVSLVRKLLPVSRIGIAMWAWRNRQPIVDWAGFSARAAQQLVSGERDDTLTEARLRASLTRDPDTRSAGIGVQVRDGVARLSGTVDREVAERAFDLAESTAGVRRVRNELRVRNKRRVLGRTGS